MPNLNVLVSGSGIAGSVFAFWLLRAFPHANITIVERDAALRLTGASVDIRSSAVDIIEWMGVKREICSQCTNEEGMQVVDVNGKASLTSEFEIFRGALAKIFIDPIIQRVNLILDESVDHFEQRDDKVVVTFAKSKESKTYDLLVAADGLGSKIRGMMLDCKSEDQFVDEGVYTVYFTIKRDLLQGDRLAKGVNATEGRAMYLRPDPNPAGRTRAGFMKITASGDVEMREKLNKAIRAGNESCMKLMEEMYHDVGWLAPEVLQAMRESDDFYCSRLGLIQSPKIHNGRVVLLGDAGYATPGFGTSLAIIGGYFLAGELLNHPGDIKTALERYEEVMLPFAKNSQGRIGFAMRLLNPQTLLGIRVRNAIFGFVTWTKLDRLAIAVSSMLGFKKKKFPLPEYQWSAESREHPSLLGKRHISPLS